MRDLLISLLAGLTASLRSRASLQVESLALRHQLAVFQRSKPKQVALRPTDRLLWVALSRLWPEWRRALMLVKPETVCQESAHFRCHIGQGFGCRMQSGATNLLCNKVAVCPKALSSEALPL
jgi:hypothetical protein